MEENGRLAAFIFNLAKEVVTETEDRTALRYIRGSELIARNTDAVRTYYHYASDEMGSITHVTDEEGNLLNSCEYDAWGNLTLEEEQVPNRFKYTGEQFDSVTQQYYLRARFYNPALARFMQEDTYRGDGLNLYAYCANNPVRYVDPSGHWCEVRQNVYERLVRENGLDINHIDPETKLRLMAQASNIVDGRNVRRNDTVIELPEPVLPEQNRPAGPEADVPDSDRCVGIGNKSSTDLKRQLININDWNGDVNDPSVRLYGTYDELCNAGVKDGHHIIQNAAVRDVAGYKRGDAPAIQADGPSTKVGSEHYNLTYDQSHAIAVGTYGKEKTIGLNSAEKNLELSQNDVKIISDYLDDYFCKQLGLNNDSTTRIPGNRHHILE